MVAGLQSRDCEDGCRELGLDTLEKRREKQDMGLVYKFLSEQVPSEIFTYTGTRNSENETGDRGKKPSAKIFQD